VTKSVIKTGAIFVNQIKGAASGVREHFEDVTAEAMGELEERPSSEPGTPGPITGTLDTPDGGSMKPKPKRPPQ